MSRNSLKTMTITAKAVALIYGKEDNETFQEFNFLSPNNVPTGD